MVFCDIMCYNFKGYFHLDKNTIVCEKNSACGTDRKTLFLQMCPQTGSGGKGIPYKSFALYREWRLI